MNPGMKRTRMNARALYNQNVLPYNFWKSADRFFWNCESPGNKYIRIRPNRKSGLIERRHPNMYHEVAAKNDNAPTAFYHFFAKERDFFKFVLKNSRLIHTKIVTSRSISSAWSTWWLCNYCIKLPGGLISDLFRIVLPCLQIK